MIIECSNCRAKYQYDESRFEGKPLKKIRCAKCQQIFAVQNPAFSSPPEEAPAPARSAAPAAAPPPDSDPELDSTMTRSRRAALEARGERTASGPMPAIDNGRLPERKRFSLAIIDGPDAGKVFRIEKPRITIGRSAADLVIDDVESSRTHAAVVVRESGVTLEDLGSTNGTLVSGEKIGGPTELHNQMEFQVGGTTLMLIVTDSE